MKKFLAALLALLLIPLTACPNQNQLAALVTIAGNAAASVAAIEGNSALSQKLLTDTAAFSKAVAAWKKGTNAQMAIEAAQLVMDDLNLFPQVGPYVPLITLAMGTIISIIQILNPPAAMAPQMAHSIANPPKTAAQFRLQWNQITVAHGLPSQLLVQ